MADNIKVLNEFLPKAQTERLGAIKIGETLSLDANEVLNVDSASMTGAYMTNCITEIPQDVNIVIENGSLVLKAGSKLYVPDGFEADGTTPKFITRITTADHTYPNDNTNQNCVIFGDGLTGHARTNVDRCFSGPAMPASPAQYDFWYDTANNILKRYIDSEWGVSSGYSLPISIVEYNSTTREIKSIKTIFDGFGYVGCTVFALPGIKGLIPNGRKADGALNDIEFCLDKPIIYTFSSDYTGPMVWGINESGLILDAEYFTEQEIEPTNLNSNWAWLNPNTNILTWNAWNGSGYTYIPAVQVCIVAKMHRTLGHIDLAEFQKPLRIANVYDVNKKLVTLQDTKLDASRIQYVSAIPANPQDGVIYLIAQ